MTDLSEPPTERNKKQATISPARLAAFDILRRVEDGAYASILLASKEDELKPADRSLVHELVLGVLRWQRWLDHLTEHYAARKISKLDPAVRIAIRLGLYQLRFLSRVPASAAVNESVKLVRRARLRSAESFVNAVLRRATREPDHDPTATTTDPTERLAIGTSHPTWLIERWIKSFGTEETRAFANENNQAAPVAFRVVPTMAREGDILAQLDAAGATLLKSEIAQGAWRMAGGGNLLRELSQAGQIYIQDEASQLVAQVLGANSGDRVLDVCSAPGGKATQIAAAADAVRVIASDVHSHRLRTVADAAIKQGLANLHTVVLDGHVSLPFSEGTFDRILVDAPCSGTGTLRHNPEIRWRISAEDIGGLSKRQKQLLLSVSRLVKVGGRLVYSTCSVEPEENEAVVSDFLQSSEIFEKVAMPVPSSLLTSSGNARTWPHRDGSDGFFIAAFERKLLQKRDTT